GRGRDGTGRAPHNRGEGQDKADKKDDEFHAAISRPAIRRASSSVATTFSGTRRPCATRSPSPCCAFRSQVCSARVSRKSSARRGIAWGACFIRICTAEFVITASPSLLDRTSPTSCVTSVSPARRFRAVFTRRKRNEARSEERRVGKECRARWE